MQVLLAFIIATALNSPDLSIDLAKTAVESCKRVRPENRVAAILNARKMLEIEKSMGVPEQFWGMSLAAACLESGFNPAAKGDKRGKTYKAIGILQLWPFYERVYKTNRLDVSSSTASWLKHIIRMVPKVKKQCKYKTIERVWVAAWVTGIRYKKPGGRCREKPLHYKQLKKIRKIIKKQLQKRRQSDR